MKNLPPNTVNFHKVLKKRMLKTLGEESLENGKLYPFLQIINDYYETIDRDRKISDHAFAISEKEYQEVVIDISNKNATLNNAIQQLNEAIATLSPDTVSVIKGGDISDLINYLIALIQQAKEVEVKLIEAKELAESASKAKSDFLSVMSHEIRTPLNSIVGYIHLLTEEDPLPRQTEYLNILKISARNLMSLINDVLDFSKIEEGKIIFSNSDFDLRKLINDIRLFNKVKAEENGNILKLMLDEDIPSFVKGDMTRITQILNNLISNAIKFTKNGRITIELQLKSRYEKRVEILFSIKDNGIGISKEKQEIIFERFMQEHSYTTREYGGTGLGLAIIRKLLNMMDSEIYLSSEQGIGSDFYFSIWFDESNVITEIAPERMLITDLLKNKRILLVEDIDFNALLATKILEKWQAIISLAKNGLEAVEMCKANKYDIILMDVQMPIMDGITASREIRMFNKEVLIVALTASTSPQMQEKFNKIGINGYVYKPIDPDNLFKTLTRLFDSRQSEVNK